MSVAHVVAFLIGLALFGYLLVALLRPEVLEPSRRSKGGRR